MPNTQQTETLPCYLNKRTGKAQQTLTFRTPSTIEEMASWCDSHSHIWIRTISGDAREVKVNGAVRRWKRDASRIEVPCKYGLYEYFTLYARDINDVLIPVA